MPPTLLPTTRLSRIVTWSIEPPVSDPVARIPSPSAPCTVNPLIETHELLIVTPARHGALPGPVGPSWSHICVVVGTPCMTASSPTSESGVETTTSSAYVPAHTTTVSPGCAASTADWIVEYVAESHEYPPLELSAVGDTNSVPASS